MSPGWPVVARTASPLETRALAGRLARVCRSGDVVLLIGDLGVGKTVFAQGFAAALGVAGPVTSPTFALVRHYACADGAGSQGTGVRHLIHADVYRTGSLDEVVDLALAELVEESAVALVEWGDLAAPALGPSALEVTLAAPGPRRRAGKAGGDAGGSGRLGLSGGRSGGAGLRARATGRTVTMVAIETATETVAVALRTPDGVQGELTVGGRRRHVETLTPALDHLFGQLGVGPADLRVVAVDLGPGLFTGLRVGVATAKALAQTQGIGVVGATSLEILAVGAASVGHSGAVLACVDARRGQVFAAVSAVEAGAPVPGTCRLGPGLFSPAGLVAALRHLDERDERDGRPGVPILAVGDGAQRYADDLASVEGLNVATPGLSYPPASALLDLATARLGDGHAAADPSTVVPIYLREADATVNFERAR